MEDTDYSYEERILIDNYIDHVNNSRQHITFILNYLSSTEQQLSRFLPENYRRLSQRQPPLTQYSSSRHILSNPRPRPLNPRRFDTQPPVSRSYSASTIPNSTSNANSYLNLLNILRGVNGPIEENLSPVIIRPTIRQINLATERSVFDSSNVYLNTICPITQQPFENGDRIRSICHCRHVFSNSSLLEWFERNTICPVCRYDIRDYREAFSNITTDTSANETTQLETTLTDISNSTSQFIQDISSNFPRSQYTYPPTSMPIPSSINTRVNNTNIDTSDNLTNSITISSTSSTFLTDLLSEDSSINPLLQIMNGLRGTNINNYEYSVSGELVQINSLM